MVAIEEEYYLRFPSGPPAQGDIWNSLPLPHAEPPTCCGIIITPRCDLAQDKSPVVNYLPILDLDQLLSSYAGFSLLEQEHHNAEKALKKTSEQLAIDEIVDLNLPSEEILRIARDASKRLSDGTPARRPRFEQAVGVIAEILEKLERVGEAMRKSVLSSEDVSNLIPDNPLRGYKRQVIRNNFPDLHFLPPCAPDLMKPSVILLRHIGTCSIGFIIETCINNRHRDHKKGGNSEPVMNERMSSGRLRTFLVRRQSVASSSSRFFGLPFARVPLKWAHTSSSGLSSGA